MAEAPVSALIARVVGACARRPWSMIAIAAAICTAAAIYAAKHVAIDADTMKLIAEDAPWRQRELALGRTFPQRAGLIAIVIDGATPELAEDAAAALTARLATDTTNFR